MSKPITSYTAATPNGYVSTIILEELGLEYTPKFLDISKNETKEPWFLKICPNGRIPAIVDHSRNDFKVFETSAIALYLAAHYDKDHIISYDPVSEPDLYSEQLQWLFFAHGGIGPMQGQAGFFSRFAPEKTPYAIERYMKETERLYQVIEDRLEGRDWLVGPHYSLADIKALPWVDLGAWLGIPFDKFKNIQAWIERCKARPATAKAFTIPIDIRTRFPKPEDQPK